MNINKLKHEHKKQKRENRILQHRLRKGGSICKYKNDIYARQRAERALIDLFGKEDLF